MKKLLYAMLAGSMVIGMLAGCGGQEEAKEKPDEPKTETVEKAEQGIQEEEAVIEQDEWMTAEEFKATMDMVLEEMGLEATYEDHDGVYVYRLNECIRIEAIENMYGEMYIIGIYGDAMLSESEDDLDNIMAIYEVMVKAFTNVTDEQLEKAMVEDEESLSMYGEVGNFNFSVYFMGTELNCEIMFLNE